MELCAATQKNTPQYEKQKSKVATYKTTLNQLKERTQRHNLLGGTASEKEANPQRQSLDEMNQRLQNSSSIYD